MDVRRALLAALFSVVLTLPLAPPAQADLVGANLFDPVIEILPPRPVPFSPYTGSICPDGAPSCIDATIAEMQRRVDIDAAECDHDAVFGLAYLRVTEDVRKAVSSGWFSDRVWLGQVDAVFARLYFNSMDAWHAGERASIPKAWRIALQAADDKAVTGLGNFMLSMNAHINRDFSYVLAEVGLTAADGTSHKADHNAYNPRLDALMDPVFAEEAAGSTRPSTTSTSPASTRWRPARSCAAGARWCGATRRTSRWPRDRSPASSPRPRSRSTPPPRRC